MGVYDVNQLPRSQLDDVLLVIARTFQRRKDMLHRNAFWHR